MDTELDKLFEDAVTPDTPQDTAPEAQESAAAQQGNNDIPPADKEEQDAKERARQAEGRRLREREERGYRAARAELSETLKRLGIVNPETEKAIENVDELEAYEKALSDKRLESGRGTAEDIRRIVRETVRETAQEKDAPKADDSQVQAQLAQIKAMDPAMTDLSAILKSEAGPKFREYVSRGLDFVEAYTLAANERLQSISANRAGAAKGSKEHLSGTTQRGEGALSVPPDEMAIIRELNPGISDADIQRYYNADKKKFGR